MYLDIDRLAGAHSAMQLGAEECSWAKRLQQTPQKILGRSREQMFNCVVVFGDYCRAPTIVNANISLIWMMLSFSVLSLH